MSVLFDPGYGKIVGSIGKTFEDLHFALTGPHSLQSKKLRFKTLYPNAIKAIDDNVAFYLGCMLWASYIKTQAGEEIEGNPCLESEYDKEGSMYEINALEAYVNGGLNRDSKYYLNQTYVPKADYVKILATYKDFLDLNEGFHKTKITNDIELPENLTLLSGEELENMKTDINTAIESNNIGSLMKYSSLIK